MQMPIGELSRLSDVTIPTIRVWEASGLLPDPPRTIGGQRRYGEEHLRFVMAVKGARALGFDLGDIRILLAFRTENTVGRLPEAVRNRILSLRKLDDALGVEDPEERRGRIVDALAWSADQNRWTEVQ